VLIQGCNTYERAPAKACPGREREAPYSSDALIAAKIPKSGQEYKTDTVWVRFKEGLLKNIILNGFKHHTLRALLAPQGRPRAAQEWPKSGPERRKSGQERPKSDPRAAKSAQASPKSSQERPRQPQDRPRRPKTAPSWSPPWLRKRYSAEDMMFQTISPIHVETQHF